MSYKADKSKPVKVTIKANKWDVILDGSLLNGIITIHLDADSVYHEPIGIKKK